MEADAIQKKNIMFVDDEQRVLDGIKRSLYHMRSEWNMKFANGGKEALALLEQSPFDVVVSDMRMPEMDGAQLLTIVQEKYPNTIRFILSGYGDRDMIMRTLESTDQFLSKPCDPAELKAAIARALESHELLDEKQLRSMVSKIRSLPTLPDLYIKLRELLDDPNSSFPEVADIIKKDVSVSAKVLHLVNSAFFGLRHRIDSVQHAITFLGIETLKAIVLTTDVISSFSEKDIATFHLRELYAHSVFVGTFAKRITESMSNDRKLIDCVSMVGILHDFGKIILMHNMPDEYERVYNEQEKSGKPLYLIEQEMLGTTHTHVGGYLMSVWGFDNVIVEAITQHHAPQLPTNAKSTETAFTPLMAVYIANILVEEQSRHQVVKQRLELDERYIEAVGLTKQIPIWRSLCKEIYEQQEERGFHDF